MHSQNCNPERLGKGDTSSLSPTVRQNMLKEALKDGARKGVGSFFWVMKIVVPFSFLTALLQYSGILGKAELLLGPLMKLVSLPAEAALPIVIGMFAGIYAAIAAMVPLGLSPEQMTLIAIFVLIAHLLPQETAIQVKAGIRPLRIVLVRLMAAMTTMKICSLYLAGELAAAPLPASRGTVAVSFPNFMLDWAVSSGFLCLKIFCIILAVMVGMEIMKRTDVISTFGKLISPLLLIAGLSRKVAPAWITAAVFGLLYGSAVVVEESKAGDLSEKELEYLQYSIGINHALIEDPCLFLPMGINPVWLWLPRFLAAAAVVCFFRAWHRLQKVLSGGKAT